MEEETKGRRKKDKIIETEDRGEKESGRESLKRKKCSGKETNKRKRNKEQKKGKLNKCIKR
jgi:hypothetical protein